MNNPIVEPLTEACVICDGDSHAVGQRNRRAAFWCPACKVEFTVEVRPAKKVEPILAPRKTIRSQF